MARPVFAARYDYVVLPTNGDRGDETDGQRFALRPCGAHSVKDECSAAKTWVMLAQFGGATGKRSVVSAENRQTRGGDRQRGRGYKRVRQGRSLTPALIEAETPPVIQVCARWLAIKTNAERGTSEDIGCVNK